MLAVISWHLAAARDLVQLCGFDTVPFRLDSSESAFRVFGKPCESDSVLAAVTPSNDVALAFDLTATLSPNGSDHCVTLFRLDVSKQTLRGLINTCAVPSRKLQLCDPIHKGIVVTNAEKC